MALVLFMTTGHLYPTNAIQDTYDAEYLLKKRLFWPVTVVLFTKKFNIFMRFYALE